MLQYVTPETLTAVPTTEVRNSGDAYYGTAEQKKGRPNRSAQIICEGLVSSNVKKIT